MRNTVQKNEHFGIQAFRKYDFVRVLDCPVTGKLKFGCHLNPLTPPLLPQFIPNFCFINDTELGK